MTNIKKNQNQVIACGACAVIVDENGNTTTSVDALARGIKHLFSKSARSDSASFKPAAARL